MSGLDHLIGRLKKEAGNTKPYRSPREWAKRMLIALAVYAVGVQLMMGLRDDLAVQLTRPLYVSEILLLVALAVSSMVAAITAMYPDAYQKPKLLTLPYLVLVGLITIVGAQAMAPLDPKLVTPSVPITETACAQCIAALSIIPSAYIFYVLRQGATVHPLQAGSFAVLAAGAIGCLTLRLEEVNDSLLHLATTHYLPTFLYAALGAVLGKWLLKW